jgi:hypothetical protein
MFESIIFRATLPACFHNETGIKMALLDSLRRLAKGFVSKHDDDAIQTHLNRDENELLQLSISITNSKLDVVDVCKVISPVIESMSVPGTLIIKTFSGCKEDMHKEDIWQTLPTDRQKELPVTSLRH